MNELTDNDKQRIEQKARDLKAKWMFEANIQMVLYEMAEYATKYERKQQNSELSLNEMERLNKYRNAIIKLEAERTEQNKTIDDIIAIVLEYCEPDHIVIRKLNSLKTK